MKKLVMFLFAMGLVAFGTSCSSDDNSEDIIVTINQLELKADKTEINVGELVNFSSSVNGKDVSDSQLFIGEKQIKSTHLFEEEGVFEVVARKEGLKESMPLKIKVNAETESDKDKENKKLVLKANVSEIIVGEEVSFSVTDGDKVVNDAEIVSDNGLRLKEGKWKSSEVGVFKFKANKEGFVDSDEVTVVVSEAPGTPTTEGNFVTVGDKAYEINNAILRVIGNDQGQALVFTTESGIDYLEYVLYTNFNESDFAVVYLAVILPENAKEIVWPQDVQKKDIQIIDAFVAKDKKLVANLVEGEEVSLNFNWGKKPNPSTGLGGQFAMTLKALSFAVNYDGEYSGLYIQPKKAGNAVANLSSLNKFTKEQAKYIKLAR
ncbi:MULTISPECIES: hypothetical protein [unclassified Myroides]|uniref:hypothetical protein n=1 Tax=unclassified Myroides TaxID=2642485 RepID=UPI0031015CB4